MALISQIIAVSYNLVLNKNRTPENQWRESALMRVAEKQGLIKRESLGPSIEVALDYRQNAAAGFLLTELQPTSLDKTEVITSAVYTPAELSVPIVWSKRDEATNPTTNQKVALAKSLIANAIDTHDDLLEQAFFATSTNGFLGLPTHIPTSGQGSDGGIDAAVNVFWRNQTATYIDETDMIPAMTSVWNSCAKGSGSTMLPSIIVSDGPTQAIFEATQQPLQRWSNTNEMNAGFKVLKFKNADYVYSQYGTSSQFFLNAKNFNLVVSREYFRDKGDTDEIQNAHGYVCKIYSALQTVTNNKSRLGVVHV